MKYRIIKNQIETLEVILRPQRALLVTSLLIIGLVLPTIVLAQAWVPRKGRLSTWVSYQNFLVNDHCFSVDDVDSLGNNLGNCFDFGNIRSQSVLFGFDLGVVRNLALSANIAFVASRYEGPGDYGGIEHTIDDGTWNEGFQDFSAALRYMLLTDPVVITPAIGYGAPTNDYQTLGHSAVGRGLQEGFVGINLGWVPSFLNRAYAQGNYTYSLVEQVTTGDGTKLDMNRSNVALALGYFITDSFSARGFGAYRKIHGGVDWTELDDTTEHIHDQAAATEDGTLGLGVGYTFTPMFSANIAYNWVAWGSNTHNGGAFTLGLNYMFGLYGP